MKMKMTPPSDQHKNNMLILTDEIQTAMYNGIRAFVKISNIYSSRPTQENLENVKDLYALMRAIQPWYSLNHH